jgi:hypothetical protein
VSEEYIALEDVRDPDLAVVTVATWRLSGSPEWITSVGNGGPDTYTADRYADDVAAWDGHRAVCRAVRLGL